MVETSYFTLQVVRKSNENLFERYKLKHIDNFISTY